MLRLSPINDDNTCLHILKQKAMWYLFIFMCMAVFRTFVHHVCLVPLEARREHQIPTTRVNQLRAVMWVLGIKLKALWKSSQCCSLSSPVCIILKQGDRCTDKSLWHFFNCIFRCSWCGPGGWQWVSASLYWSPHPIQAEMLPVKGHLES